MSRNFCDLSGGEYYTGAELGRRLEVRLEKDGLKHRQYYKGEMVRLLNEAGVKSVNGKWLGKDAIPVLKAEYERVKNNPKKRKAKSTSKQTSQKNAEDINKIVGSTLSSLSHQLSVEEINEPQYLKDLDLLRQKLCEAADLVVKAFEELLGGK